MKKLVGVKRSLLIFLLVIVSLGLLKKPRVSYLLSLVSGLNLIFDLCIMYIPNLIYNLNLI